jgi:hypothetical protein
MSYQNVTPIQQQEAHKKTWFQRFRNKVAVGSTAVGSYALANTANAAGEYDLTAIGTAITGQLSASGTIIVSILIAAATLTALIIGYRKLNTGAKAA